MGDRGYSKTIGAQTKKKNVSYEVRKLSFCH